MRFIKYEKKNKGRNTLCYGCDVPVEKEILNALTFKNNTLKGKSVYLCNSCAEVIGAELVRFSQRKGSPTNLFLGYELQQRKKETAQNLRK